MEGDNMSAKVELLCDNCGRTFERWPSEIRKQTKRGYKHVYCSFDCFRDSPKRKKLVARLAIERTPVPTIDISDVDASYIAGIIDGEGSFNISPGGGKRLNVGLTVGNTYKPMVDKLLEDTNVGTVYPHQYREGQNNTLWIWAVNSRVHLVVLLPKLIPYLIAKKRQAELVLKFCQRRVKGIYISDGDWQLRDKVMKENNRRFPQVNAP
jgi:hypothetical protein